MIAKTQSASIVASRVHPVQVEVDILPGSMNMQIVGLADNAVKESRERIRSAISRSGYHFPVRWIVVNLAPNELAKEGGLVELAIAVAILQATGQFPAGGFERTLFLGSLSLDGGVQPARGLLAAAILARRQGFTSIVQSASTIEETACIPGLKRYPVRNLADLAKLADGSLRPLTSRNFQSTPTPVEVCMGDISGLEQAKRGLAYAAIGEHHTLLLGAPGTGKTMLSRAFPAMLPPLSLDEALAVTEIHSLAGLSHGELVSHRPFRSPHHTTSDIALIGGGTRPTPGEISLAHRGVLFLDELLEFRMASLQALREPLEEGRVTVSRARSVSTFPADFILLAATNPCRCGALRPGHHCGCPQGDLRKLYQKVIGPFMDRICLEIETVKEKPALFQDGQRPKSSSWWRSKVQEARLRMRHRNGGLTNRHLPADRVMALARQVPNCNHLLAVYSTKLNLSHRSLINSLRTALSILDFQEKGELTAELLEEAFHYRRMKMYHDHIKSKVA